MSILTESYTSANKSTLSSAKHREKGATQRFIVVVLNQECSYLNTPDLILPSQALFSVRTQLAVLSEVLDGTDHLRGVGVLVVVPGHDLNLIGVIVDLSDHGLGSIEQRAVTHADDIGRNDQILVVAEGLRGSSLHSSVDGLLGDVLALDNSHQDGGGAGGNRHTLSRADQLAVQLGG